MVAFRRPARLAACVALAVCAAACDTLDNRFFREGIGTEVYATDIVEMTRRQNEYLAELCQQTLPIFSETSARCANIELQPRDWPLVVQAGITDIDRRCNAYLNWLDQRKRTNTAFLKQLGDTNTATQAIMQATGATAAPITIVGLAFGLAANTFTNINSRLLFEVDKTVVQAIVLRWRKEFRDKLRQDIEKGQVNSRPAAVDTLQSYLLICTPFTIETNINTTNIVFQVAGPGALDRARPLVESAPLTARTAVFRPERPLPPFDEAHRTIIANFNPRWDSIGHVQNILRRLCAPPAEVNKVTSKVNARIFAYQQFRREFGGDTLTNVTGLLSRRDMDMVASLPVCPSERFSNVYEAEAFPRGINDPGLIELMNKRSTALGLPPLPPGATVEQVRARIPELRKALNSKLLKHPGLSDQLTWDLVEAL
jgi:hypothetical protein